MSFAKDSAFSVTFFIAKKVTKKSSPSKNSLAHLFICLALGLVASPVRFSNQFLFKVLYLKILVFS